jgi:hypothetical protein
MYTINQINSPEEDFMRRTAMIVLATITFFFSTPGIFAQNSRYPQAARALAGDGFARRQNGYISRIGKESMDANKHGFQAYQKKDYPTAIRHFESAVTLDKKNMFAHFNLACTLSLAYGAGDPEVLGKIRHHLAAAADLDVHWVYKAFTDSDLDPVRARPIDFSLYFPCPGDCCLDQHYYLHADGTAEYATEYPDLSGMGGHKDPAPQARGWSCLIGDCFVIYIPGQSAILSQSSADPSMIDENEQTKDGLIQVTFAKDRSGKITDVNRGF